MQEAFTPTLEQVMKNTDAYLFVLTISIARHTDRSGDSDMTGQARTNHLSSSSDAGRTALRHDDHIRQKYGCHHFSTLRHENRQIRSVFMKQTKFMQQVKQPGLSFP